tara:strand:- start:1084 stop:1650 length:567 start_codon:yes stop_codon:yes gene_type:complete
MAAGKAKAPKVYFDLRGIKEFQQGVVNELPQKIRGRIMRDVFRKAAKPAVKTMKEEVPKQLPTKRKDPFPKDPSLKDLRKSIGHKVKTYKGSGTTIAVIGPRRGDKYRSKRDNVRLTTVAVGIERGWRGRPKNRFVRRAYIKVQKQFKKDLKKNLQPAIDREAAKIFKKYSAGKKLSSSEQTAMGMLK